MSIRKRGAHYWLDIWVRNKRIRRSLRTAEYALALERARDIAIELRRPAPAGVPIGEFFDKYRAWARETKPASYRNEDRQLKWLKAWFDGQGLLTLEQVSTHHVEFMRSALLAKRIGKSERTIARPTINRYMALLRSCYAKAIDWEMFKGANPVSRIRFYKEGQKVRPLAEAEIAAILAAAESISRDKHTSPTGRAIYDICRLILNTGLRRSEAMNLRFSDVIDDEIRVRGKGGKVRMIPLNADAAETILRQPRLTQFIFDVPNRNSPGRLRRVTETIKRRTKVPFHLHLLRHAFASRLLAAGVDIVTIGDLMGHSSSMVSLLYTHSNAGLKKKAVLGLSRPDPSPHTGDA